MHSMQRQTVVLMCTCVQPLTCDDIQTIPSGSEGLWLPCVLFSLIHPFYLAFLTLDWHCRPISLPGHWEFSWCSWWPIQAGICLLALLQQALNRRQILVFSIYGKIWSSSINRFCVVCLIHKTGIKQTNSCFTGDWLNYFLGEFCCPSNSGHSRELWMKAK